MTVGDGNTNINPRSHPINGLSRGETPIGPAEIPCCEAGMGLWHDRRGCFIDENAHHDDSSDSSHERETH